jgi:hypothetical protein
LYYSHLEMYRFEMYVYVTYVLSLSLYVETLSGSVESTAYIHCSCTNNNWIPNFSQENLKHVNTILKLYLPKQKRYVARRWDDIQYRIVIVDCIMKKSYNFRWQLCINYSGFRLSILIHTEKRKTQREEREVVSMAVLGGVWVGH